MIRSRFIPRTRVSINLFGEKKKKGEFVRAVKEEFGETVSTGVKLGSGGGGGGEGGDR